MRYSLLGRFRGALLGCALGEVLGFHCQTRLLNQLSIPWLDLEHWGFDPILASSSAQGWGQIAVDGMQQLIHNTRWDMSRWGLGKPVTEPPSPVHPQSRRLEVRSAGGLAIASLPLSLYFHEDLHQLRYQIQQVVAFWYPPPAHQAAILPALLIPAHAIALALQEQLHPHALRQDIAGELGLTNGTLQAIPPLNDVQALLQENTPLASVSHDFQRIVASTPEQGAALNAIAAALYGFLKTPEDFRLSLLQTAHLGYQPQITCALAGAFSGAYNGVAGLPLTWRRLLQRHPAASPLTYLWNTASDESLMQLADYLLASWSGAYSPMQYFKHSISVAAVAAPNVIRPW